MWDFFKHPLVCYSIERFHLESPRFVPFSANCGKYKPKFDIPDGLLCLCSLEQAVDQTVVFLGPVLYMIIRIIIRKKTNKQKQSLFSRSMPLTQLDCISRWVDQTLGVSDLAESGSN